MGTELTTARESTASNSFSDGSGEAMSPDRYGEPADRPCRDARCRRGWIGADDEGRPIPCLACKPHLAKTSTTNDCAESIPSAKAQAAIDREDRK
ncbi:hypothetical protein [Nocardia sp. NPDC004260]